MIEVQNISKTFGPITAIDSISFSLKSGEVVGFLGPNGAGKTTTMRILTGFLPPSSGTCIIDNIDVSKDPVTARKKIGYLPESAALYTDMEVTDYLTYIAQLRDVPPDTLLSRLKSVVHSCGLQKVLGRKIGTLSKGYRQRVGLAQALIHDPEILVLDEPTVGLDPNQIVEIRSLIKEIGKNKTVLLSTHILPEVEQTCERVIIIQDGKIAGQGTLDELTLLTRGSAIYYVGVKAARSEIEAGLRKIESVEKIDFIKSETDIHTIRMACSNVSDKREEIFKTAVANKWVLVELRREEANLETVFKKLTA